MDNQVKNVFLKLFLVHPSFLFNPSVQGKLFTTSCPNFLFTPFLKQTDCWKFKAWKYCLSKSIAPSYHCSILQFLLSNCSRTGCDPMENIMVWYPPLFCIVPSINIAGSSIENPKPNSDRKWSKESNHILTFAYVFRLRWHPLAQALTSAVKSIVQCLWICWRSQSFVFPVFIALFTLLNKRVWVFFCSFRINLLDSNITFVCLDQYIKHILVYSSTWPLSWWLPCLVMLLTILHYLVADCASKNDI